MNKTELQNKYENEILDLINHYDDITTSDMQGIVSVIVRKLLNESKIDDTTLGSLKRIVSEVKEKRNATCLMKDCIINHIIGGNDIDLVEDWIAKTK